MPPSPSNTSFVALRNSHTGSAVLVPKAALTTPALLPALRRRLRTGDVQSAWAGESDNAVTVDTASSSYTFARYPPLGFFINVRWFIILGAFFIAGCAQVQFLFPCLSGYATVPFKGASYCVPSARVNEVTSSVCPADICSKRIPVTMQTYGVLLVGAIAGRAGSLATLLYVAMVCVGAPFSASAKPDPMWNKGAIVGASGGYFVGFIAASFIMGVAAERGAGRGAPRSLARLVLWMFAAEGALYAFALFWMPFGMAIARGVAPAAICPESAGIRQCIDNVFAWGFTPFVPGDLFKMALVAFTVPAAWSALLALHRWRHGGSAHGEGEALTATEEAEMVRDGDAGAAGVVIDTERATSEWAAAKA